MRADDWISLGLTVVLIAAMVGWNIQLRKEHKANVVKAAAEKLMLEKMDQGIDQLKTAALISLWAQHNQYHADDTTFPGLISVKCGQCGEQCGTVSDQSDMFALAEVHVMEKFELIVANVKKAEEKVAAGE